MTVTELLLPSEQREETKETATEKPIDPFGNSADLQVTTSHYQLHLNTFDLRRAELLLIVIFCSGKENPTYSGPY